MVHIDAGLLMVSSTYGLVVSMLTRLFLQPVVDSHVDVNVKSGVLAAHSRIARRRGGLTRSSAGRPDDSWQRDMSDGRRGRLG